MARQTAVDRLGLLAIRALEGRVITCRTAGTIRIGVIEEITLRPDKSVNVAYSLRSEVEGPHWLLVSGASSITLPVNGTPQPTPDGTGIMWYVATTTVVIHGPLSTPNGVAGWFTAAAAMRLRPPAPRG